MDYPYPRIISNRKEGSERFVGGEFDVLDFWRWMGSDLLSNSLRGVLAEYLVMKALGIEEEVRDPWAAYDLTTSDGVKVEVKSAAHIQSWAQRKLSTISFSTRPTLAWDSVTNLQAKVKQWQSDVFVFALLFHQEQETINPMDLAQWRFYVVPTWKLAKRERSQHSITLRSLEAITIPVGYGEIRAAVDDAGLPKNEREASAKRVVDQRIPESDLKQSRSE